MPYVNKECNYLTDNPNSSLSPKEDREHVLRVRDVAKILHYHENNWKAIANYLLQLQMNGERMFGLFTVDRADFGDSVLVVNPAIYYGGDYGEKLQNELTLFSLPSGRS